jgi:hypothetical protein
LRLPWLTRGLLALALFAPFAVRAIELDIREVALDTRALIGHPEDPSPQNGGSITNAGFIATPQGTLVIDTSASKALGEAWRSAIEGRAKAPIVRVFNTLLHPTTSSATRHSRQARSLPCQPRDSRSMRSATLSTTTFTAWSATQCRARKRWCQPTPPSPASSSLAGTASA